MSARSLQLPLACALALTLGGCAAFISKEEYAVYRAVRMAHSEGQRLVAMQRYVSAFPEGAYHDELQVERRARDLEVFESGKATRAGLELYLAAFSDGTFVEQARARLSAIAVIEARKQQDELRAAALVEERKKRDAELRHTWVSRFLGYWVETLTRVSNWGAPIEEVARANADFSRAFGRPPRPRCTGEECVKYYDSSYAVPVPGGTRIERHMRLILRLGMAGGKLDRATLLLPGWGFSRWREVEERRAVIDGDPEDRKAAVDWAMGRILALLEKLPGELVTLAGHELGSIAAPAVGPSGELTDTTAADPSAPANRIQGSAPSGTAGGSAAAGADAEPAIGDLVRPEEPEETDMVMDALGVDKEGRAVKPTEMRMAPLDVPQAGGEGDVMDMGAITVPQDGQAPAAARGDADDMAAMLEAQALVAPPVVRAYRSGNVRIVFFSASTDAAAPAYDGVLIERVDAR